MPNTQALPDVLRDETTRRWPPHMIRYDDEAE